MTENITDRLFSIHQEIFNKDSDSVSCRFFCRSSKMSHGYFDGPKKLIEICPKYL